MMNRILLILVAATLLLQATNLYLQHGRRVGTSQPSPVRDAPAGTTIDLSGVPMEGNSDARVVMLEFSDYECPFCVRHATGVGKDIHEKFIKTGRLRHAFLNNPLPIHPAARLLAKAAICAGKQDAYWKMHDLIFEFEPKSSEEIISLFGRLSLNSNAFEICLGQSKEGDIRIEQDIRKAKEFKLSGTPTFAIGVIDRNGNLEIKKFLVGAAPFSVFESSLSQFMDGANDGA